MSRNKPTADTFIDAIAAHPYLCALFVCLAVNPLYYCSSEYASFGMFCAAGIAVLLAGAYIIIGLYLHGKLNIVKTVAVAVGFLLIFCFGAEGYCKSQVQGVWLLLVGCATVFLLYYFTQTQRPVRRLNGLVIMSLSFLVKFYYVFYTSVYTRQNDVHTFGGDNGHAAYMEYLLYNRKLPDFDVREVWQFCHPPLHHIICAVWIGISEAVGVGYNPARESLQTLTLFYSMTIMITAYKILRHFKLDGAALYVPLLIIAFHPSFILLSGSINNDVLSVAFMMGAILCTLRWYENQTMAGILKIALCVGLGMMTKLSAALVAPPIALVFLIVFIRKLRTDGLRLFGEFSAFAVVCVPLGLWFEIKNLIKFDVPITYVQEMSDTATQYIGNQSFISRITDFSSGQFKSVFEQWLSYDDSGQAVGYNEYNPLVTLLKNSLFGEGINESYFENIPNALMLTRVFFILGAVIAAVAFVLMIVMMFVHSDCADGVHKAFFAVFYLTMMANFYKMAHDYPFTCTMNFRYITPTVIIGSLFIGLFTDRIKKQGRAGGVVSTAFMSLAFVFAVLSAVTYVMVCYPEV